HIFITHFIAEGGGLRPGRIIESDKLSADVRKRAMDAVDKSGRRVTVGDVASKAGIKLTEAQRALQAIAADTNGFLEVSDEGDVLYVFPKDYRSKLAAKSLRIKTEPYLEKAKSAGEYLIRVTFGTALIASIVIVYTTIIAILTSSSEEDNRGRRRGRSFDSGFSFYLSPSDLFWYWDPYYYRRRRVRKEGNGMNFIESVFSFVFGDGDPNEGIEEERWKLIGQYIASNGGVVTAEELAPYLDVESAEKTDDDSYVLPVLLRFDGQPQVDEEGNILYRFPSLQRTASQTSGRKEYVGRRFSEWVGEVDKFFKENKWDFSKISSTERAMVGGLGALNLFGVIVLGTMLKNMTVSPSGFISFVSEIFPLLQVYAASFFAIPLVRWFITQKTNAEIDKRNRAREQRARALELPDLSLRRKILSARDMSQRTVIRQDQIVYTTERDIFEQDYDTQEWDRRFKEIDKSD
nr:iron-sulfur cluster biosynthesis family protein [Tanacetum cinerariifolium]